MESFSSNAKISTELPSSKSPLYSRVASHCTRNYIGQVPPEEGCCFIEEVSTPLSLLAWELDPYNITTAIANITLRTQTRSTDKNCEIAEWCYRILGHAAQFRQMEDVAPRLLAFVDHYLMTAMREESKPSEILTTIFQSASNRSGAARMLRMYWFSGLVKTIEAFK